MQQSECLERQVNMETHNSFLAMMMDGMKNAPKGPAVPEAPDRHGKYKENMYKVWKHVKPDWLPMGADLNLVIPDTVLERPALNKGGKDWLGVEWEFVPAVGAPSVKPGVYLFEDIEEWEDKLIFPDLNLIDWKTSAEDIKKELNPEKPNEFVLFNGGFERMHSLMGFENALCALLTDPDSCKEYFNRIADFKIEVIDRLIDNYDVDTICYHDDWGHKTNTFFSEEVFKNIIMEPTARIVDHVHSRGKNFTLHCCGKNESLVPYMVEMGVDSWESAQMDINDLPGIRSRIKDSMGIEFIPKDPCFMNPDTPKEVLRSTLRNIIMAVAADGPTIITHMNAAHPDNKPILFDEFYKISDEIYK